jgi:uncharacterized protein YdiU (UPF0061 family)
MKLAEALDPLLPEAKSEVIVESMYQSTYLSTYTDLMRKRLGLLFEQPGDQLGFSFRTKHDSQFYCYIRRHSTHRVALKSSQ